MQFSNKTLQEQRSFIHSVKHSAVGYRRCDLSPERSVSCQLQSISRRYSRVPADLMNPGIVGGRPRARFQSDDGRTPS